MLDTNLLELLTLERLALIAALFLLIYVNKQALEKWYRHFSNDYHHLKLLLSSVPTAVLLPTNRYLRWQDILCSVTPIPTCPDLSGS